MKHGRSTETHKPKLRIYASVSFKPAIAGYVHLLVCGSLGKACGNYDYPRGIDIPPGSYTPLPRCFFGKNLVQGFGTWLDRVNKSSGSDRFLYKYGGNDLS